MLLFTIIFGGLLLMMGHHARSESLFYYFRLEDQVPESHLLRLNHVAVRTTSAATLAPKAIDIFRCNIALGALPTKYKSKLLQADRQGVLISSRRLFAFLEVKTRNGDFAITTQRFRSLLPEILSGIRQFEFLLRSPVYFDLVDRALRRIWRHIC